MVDRRTRHHHHHRQGHSPQHLTTAQEAPGVGALPQDSLGTQDGVIPQIQLGVAPTQAGGTKIELPQTIASACSQLA